MESSVDSIVKSIGVPVYIGLVIGCFLCGIFIGQAFFYYRCYRNDPARTKLLVMTILILDLVHTTFIVGLIYDNNILGHDNLLKFITVPWLFTAESVITYCTILISHSFYAFRVWIVGDKNKIVTGLILLLSLLQIGSGMEMAAQLIIAHGDLAIVRTPAVKDCAILEPLAATACDLLIAVSMAYFLRKKRTGFRRVENIINRIIFYTVSLGLGTSLVLFMSFVLYVGLPESWSFLVFHLLASKSHANSVLALLNTRINVRNIGGSVLDTDIMKVPPKQAAASDDQVHPHASSVPV